MSSGEKAPLFTLSCREASRLISDALDRELTRRERWSLRLHMLLCTACKRFAQQASTIRMAIAKMPDHVRQGCFEAAAGLTADRKTQIKRLLAQAGQAEAQD